jgi:hypothetical protein
VIENETTEKQFEQRCGKAMLVLEDRGCRVYRTQGESLRYCFEEGKLKTVRKLVSGNAYY